MADCLAWMDQQPANSVHAIVTDPPYGLKEYTAPEKQKLRRGKGAVYGEFLLRLTAVCAARFHGSLS